MAAWKGKRRVQNCRFFLWRLHLFRVTDGVIAIKSQRGEARTRTRNRGREPELFGSVIFIYSHDLRAFHIPSFGCASLRFVMAKDRHLCSIQRVFPGVILSQDLSDPDQVHETHHKLSTTRFEAHAHQLPHCCVRGSLHTIDSEKSNT